MPIIHALILAAAAHATAAAPATVRLQRVTVEVPNPDVMQVTLHAASSQGVRSGLSGQRLRLGEATVRLASPVDLTVGSGDTRVHFTVKLSEVPGAVLGLDPNRMPVLWEGLGGGGEPVLAVGGTFFIFIGSFCAKGESNNASRGVWDKIFRENSSILGSF